MPPAILVGLHEMVTIIALAMQVAVGWILFSPVRSLRQHIVQPDDVERSVNVAPSILGGGPHRRC